MFALRSGLVSSLGGKGPRSPHSGVVVPRLLRRPARFLSRVLDDGYTPPRFAGLMLVSGLFAATALYGIVQGGHSSAVLSSITARTGFALNDIRVSGNRETSEIDILGQLDLSGFTSLMGLDAEEVRGDVETLPWVRSARVRKIYPDALDINIVERDPFAIWQQGEALSVIQADGRVIAPFRNGHNASLPLVIGTGAPERAAAFISTVAQFPALSSHVSAYILVAGRRWDLRLDNGVTIKLPERGASAALAEVVTLDREQALLSRGVVAVDVRLPDRIGIQLAKEDAELLRASMREKLGISSKPGRRT